MAGSSYQILQDQVKVLGERMENNFNEVKALLAGYEARMRALEQREAACQPLIRTQMEHQAARLVESEALLKTVQAESERVRAQVQELQSGQKLLRWFAGLVCSAVVIWLVSNLLALVK